jgi:hypothetical protein
MYFANELSTSSLDRSNFFLSSYIAKGCQLPMKPSYFCVIWSYNYLHRCQFSSNKVFQWFKKHRANMRILSLCKYWVTPVEVTTQDHSNYNKLTMRLRHFSTSVNDFANLSSAWPRENRSYITIEAFQVHIYRIIRLQTPAANTYQL